MSSISCIWAELNISILNYAAIGRDKGITFDVLHKSIKGLSSRVLAGKYSSGVGYRGDRVAEWELRRLPTSILDVPLNIGKETGLLYVLY